jgi:glycosyltransferase involved in cell wall biosynthesis
MRVIIFSWEYPPRIVGQLAEYVKRLASQLVKNDVEVYVVTYHDFPTEGHDDSDGVKTVRVTNPVHTHIGVLTWVLTLNQEVERAAANVYYDAGKHVELIDAHDWHFVPAAVTLKKAVSIPFVYSVDSLEEHRSHGTNSPFSMAIRSIEWLGMYEAKKITVKSDWMKNEVLRLYKLPAEKITVVSPHSANWIQDVLATYSNVAQGVDC